MYNVISFIFVSYKCTTICNHYVDGNSYHCNIFWFCFVFLEIFCYRSIVPGRTCSKTVRRKRNKKNNIYIYISSEELCNSREKIQWNKIYIYIISNFPTCIVLCWADLNTILNDFDLSKYSGPPFRPQKSGKLLESPT